MKTFKLEDRDGDLLEITDGNENDYSMGDLVFIHINNGDGTELGEPSRSVALGYDQAVDVAENILRRARKALDRT